MPCPDEDAWCNIAAAFERYANFLHCIGAVDGKHIWIIKPNHTGSLYYIYKQYFYIVLFVVADTEHCFRFVDICSCGKHSDSTFFQQSNLWKKIQGNTMKIPKPNLLPGFDEVLPYAFVGDEALGLSTNLQRPYSGHKLVHNKKEFNYRLSRARRYDE